MVCVVCAWRTKYISLPLEKRQHSISLFDPVIMDSGGGGWMKGIFFLIPIVNSLYIVIFTFIFLFKTKLLWVLKFGQVGEWVTSFSKLQY